jgi:hypothetical protein
MIKTSVALGLVLASVSAHAAGEIQRGRFQSWLVDLRRPLESSRDADRVAEALLGDSARVSSFHLQGLGTLYSEQDEAFKDFRKAFKSLEDGIGGYDKWDKILSKAEQRRAPRSQIEELRRKRDEARAEFVERLREEGWIVSGRGQTRLRELTSFLDTYRFKSYDDDRKAILKALGKQLKKVEETQYDLTILEHGDGLHELRRELRWFLIQARALGGLVIFKSDREGCPVAELEALLSGREASSTYGNLPVSRAEREPCRISRCLFVGVSDAVSELGKLKD